LHPDVTFLHFALVGPALTSAEERGPPYN
jgi:hypothetical protein